MNYALITGASKGIGKALAAELAANKVNVLLVARTSDLLKELADSLKQQYGIETDYLAIDLAAPNAAKEISDWCQQKNYGVDILINNAGYGLSGAFESHPIEAHINMMQVNMNALVELCYLFLPQLKKQPQAYILNIASAAAYQAVPGLSLYAASKAFVLSFSRGLHYELRHTSVKVTTVCPGATDTDFPNRAKVGEKARKAGEKLNMTPEAVAKLALAAMYAGKTEMITGMVNKIGALLVWLMPKKLAEKAGAGIYSLD